VGTLKTLDAVHSELQELSQKTLSDGRPAYLFRGERENYPDTLSSADRHYHNQKLDPEIAYELDDITAFAMSRSFQFLSRQLPPKLAGAFAQHYGLPTQIFDFTASPNVAISFAANRPWHKSKATIGTIGILDVQLAEQNGSGVFVDLRGFPEALRARRQEAFGMIYGAFDVKDFVDLKRTDIAKKVGLTWQLFGHLPDDEAYLYLVGADEDLLSIQDDVFAGIPEEIVDQFVLTRGPLSDQAAKILAENVPAFMRSPQENCNQWSKGRKD
jgi:FRG domain